MADDLRAQIIQTLMKTFAESDVRPVARMSQIADAILPLVEQEIQQEREKLGVQLNDQMREVAVLQRRALAEKDALLTALQAQVERLKRPRCR